MKEPNILVVADRGEFSQTLMSGWHSERVVPAFTVMSSEVFQRDACRACDLIIIGLLERERLAPLMEKLGGLDQPVIVVAGDGFDMVAAHGHGTQMMVLRQHEGWVDVLTSLASECLRRVEATVRAQKAEEAAADMAAQAMLGRYMLEMRHNLNNALTSVLGNAELLLMEPGSFSEEVRDQLTTIRSMSLRMNEILARFSSLETELKFAKREAKGDMTSYVRSSATGWTSF